MKCPQCETPLRLEVATEASPEASRTTPLRRFQLIDLLALTALVAIHFASFPAASKGESDIVALLYLFPTAVTCLTHLRLCLKIPSAMLVHYILTVAWTFLHAVGLNYATNTYNPMRRSGRPVEMAVYSNAWNDTLEMAGWAVAFAVAYGAICYTALTAAATRDQRSAGLGAHNGG